MRVWDTGRASAKTNMSQDEFLLQSLEHDPQAALHLYDWQGDCVTHGHFIRPEKYFHLDKIQQKNLDLQKRPTGGGIIFHMYDVTFSLAIPIGHPLYFVNTMECYAAVNNIVVEVICDFLGRSCEPTLLDTQPKLQHVVSKHFCMACPTKYDVILDGKVGGSAQRRTRHGYLHQGSISVVKPSYDLLCEVLRDGDQVVQEMEQQGQALLPEGSSDREFLEAKQTLRQLLKKSCKS
ncbi:MAG: Octanoyltransferase LipM [Chlamydiae bacterium]|nr:Octanoyltransferase LipM [Chlamydiota bacterium]